jgi:hypothetical protein
VGFREAREATPKNFLAAWGAQEGDELFASVMQDWSFTLAMVECYSYCPGCGNWETGPSVAAAAAPPTKAVSALLARLTCSVLLLT